jgi:hypothetical protein
MKNIITIVLFVLVFVSCSDDFLERAPLSSLTSESWYNTKDEIKAAINAVYDPLQHQQLYSYGASRWGAKTDEMYRAFDWYGYSYTPTNSSSNTMRNDLYQGILSANVFIDKTEKSNFGADFLDPLKGEAYFLRGFYYYHLIRWFGGVPLITQPVSAETNLQLPRNLVEEVYAQIISDLELAIEKLPLKSKYSQTDLGRATKGTAQTVLANMYLFRANPGDLEKVKSLTEQVINSKEYDLAPTYRVIFELANENGIESIFEAQMQKGSKYADGSRINTYITSYNSTSVQENFYNLWDPTDLRRDVAVCAPGKTINDYSNKSAFYHQAKMILGLHGPTSVAGNVEDSPMNYMIERYANVLLMNAEAVNELSASPSAEIINNVNRLRRRAGLTDISATISKEDFRMAIRKERKYELAFEGHRWFDLLRYEKQGLGGGVADVLVDINSPHYNPNVILPKHYMMPIPQTEIDRVPLLTQNTGY